MSSPLLSPQELRIWHAFQLMHADVLHRVDQDLLKAGLTGPEFAVLSRLVGIGKGEMGQQALARTLDWDKSRMSHQLTRMQRRGLIERRATEKKTVLVVATPQGRERLDASRPVHAESVRRNLLSRLTSEQVETIIRVSNMLGDEP